MIDIGVNLFSSQFAGEHDALLDEAFNAGVLAMLITGTELSSSQQALAFCQQRAAHGTRCYATAGVHPHHADQLPKDWLQQLEQMANQPQVVALGEMGLDYFRNFSKPNSQQHCFRSQVGLASDCSLPLFVHDRDASVDTLGILQEELLAAGDTDLSRVVIHCFTGTARALDAYLEAGCYIGITGWVSDVRRGQELRALVPKIPLQRLLIETDAPYLKPQNAPITKGKHKRRNTPAMLPYVAATLAELYQVSPAEIAQHSSANALELFKLDLAKADLDALAIAQPAAP